MLVASCNCSVVSLITSSLFILVFVFFFKQKTAYEMRISDWSSDVCSSDLLHRLQRVLVLIEEGVAEDAVGGRIGVQPLHDEVVVLAGFNEIGRASCRERVCQYV